MKMAWLCMHVAFIFVSASSWAKSCRTAASNCWHSPCCINQWIKRTTLYILHQANACFVSNNRTCPHKDPRLPSSYLGTSKPGWLQYCSSWIDHTVDTHEYWTNEHWAALRSCSTTKPSYSIADHQREWIFKCVNEPLELPEKNADQERKE